MLLFFKYKIKIEFFKNFKVASNLDNKQKHKIRNQDIEVARRRGERERAFMINFYFYLIARTP
jgi:hypothetical protein